MGKNKRINPWNQYAETSQGARDAYFEHDGTDRNDRPHQERENWRNYAMEELLQLHTSEHPGIQLVPDQLTGNNFLNWRKSIRRALLARSKLELLDGTIAQPDIQSPYYKSWIKVDSIVSSWIINSISKEIASAFNHIESTQKLWAALNHRFHRKNGPKIARLQREINGYLQGNQSVLTYFNNLTALWNELDMALPPISCVCDARAVVEEREENQRLMQFLNGLNDSYENARNQVLFLDPLPNVDKAYSMILQVEDQKLTGEMNGAGIGQLAMNVGNQSKGNTYGKQYNFKGRRSKEEKMNLYCVHCHRTGHEENECFKLHGIPDWYRKLKEGRVKVNYVESSSQGDKD